MDRFFADPARVGVLDPQDERTAVVTSEQPREQRAADVAHMQRATGGRRESAADLVLDGTHPVTGLASVPTPSTSTSTMSPSASLPTPSGVPVMTHHREQRHERRDVLDEVATP